MTSQIKEAFDYYIAHQDELVRKYDGKVIVIRDCSVIGAFDGYGEALDWAEERFEPGSYALQKVSEGPKDYIITVHTPVMVRVQGADGKDRVLSRSEVAPPAPVTRELGYYFSHQKEMVEKYDGKVIVMKDCTVLNAFDDYPQAYAWATERFKIGTFLAQRVSRGVGDYTVPWPAARPQRQV